MQIHAVPDSERAFDSSGRRLPWGFEGPDTEGSKRRTPEERGPFGKARKRGPSRSKTPNVSSAQDLAKQENLKHIDDIFAAYKADDKQRSLRKSSSQQVPVSASAPNLLEAGPLSASFQAGASTNGTKIPKEVILYGFGEGQQWAAISKFEEISNGVIYEEYERHPNEPKFGLFSAHRANDINKLSSSWRGKITTYVGGDHWVKVTFDSVEAADRAIHWSPHSIWGFEVYAEEYRGTRPVGGDRPIPAGSASITASPNTMSSATIEACASQSSATGLTPTPARRTSRPRLGAFPDDDLFAAPPPASSLAPPPHTLASSTSSQPRESQPSTSTLRLSKIKAPVKLGEFKAKDKIFLPSRSKWQETLSHLPIIGWVVGSGSGLIGDQVPRKEDGTFDAANASLYWWTWHCVDQCLGTDFCGVKEAEYED